MTSYVETRQDGHVLEIKVNRPEKHNALSPEMFSGLAQAYGELHRNPDLRVAILHAEGKHFTSGIELDKWAPVFASGQGFSTQDGEIDPFGLQGERHRKPVIMAGLLLGARNCPWERLEREGLADFFTRDLDLPAADCIFVGDRLDRDIAPARAAGMATIQFRTGRWRKQRPRTEAETPDEVVTDVAELEAAILKLVQR
mgnify:CR=1 FL=1